MAPLGENATAIATGTVRARPCGPGSRVPQLVGVLGEEVTVMAEGAIGLGVGQPQPQRHRNGKGH